MAPHECAEQALALSQNMLEAAQRTEWDEAVKFAALLDECLSDGKGGWRSGWSEAEVPLLHNLQLNVNEAVERMQLQRDDLLSLLGNVRTQQRLQASYGGGE